MRMAIYPFIRIPLCPREKYKDRQATQLFNHRIFFLAGLALFTYLLNIYLHFGRAIAGRFMASSTIVRFGVYGTYPPVSRMGMLLE
jgi:small-conductance mechanosensitive channel